MVVAKSVAVQRDAALRRSMEAEELLRANDAAKDPDIEEVDGGETASGVLKTQTLACHTVLVAKMTQLLEDVAKQVDEVSTRLVARHASLTAAGEDTAGIEQMQAELQEKHDKVKLHVNGTTKNQLDRYIIEIRTAKTTKALKTLKADAPQIQKNMRGDAQKDLAGAMGKVKKYLTTAEKSESGRGKTAKGGGLPVQSAVPRSPLNAVMEAMADVEGFEMSTCVYEAKAGIKAAELIPVGNKEPVNTLAKCTAVKSLLKDVRLSLKTTGARWTHAPFNTQTPNGKKVQAIIRRSYDGQSTTRMVLPDLDWAHKLYSPDLVVENPGNCTVGMGHNCCAEGRLYLESEKHIVIGIPYNTVPGTTMSEKREHLSRSTVDSLHALMQTDSHCWKKCMTQADATFIPAGHMLVSANLSDKELVYIKWSVSNGGTDGSDNARVKMILEAFLKAFPELAAPSIGLSPFLDYLKDLGV